MPELPDGTNLNNLTEAGEYRVRTATTPAPSVDWDATYRMVLWQTLRLSHYDKDWKKI